MVPRTVLVPYDGSLGADGMLQVACDTVGARGGSIVVLALTQVHRALPLRDLPAMFDEPSRNALLHAEEVASWNGTQIESRLRRTYDAAQAIVREARAIQADAIFLAVKPPRFSWFPLRPGRMPRAVMHAAPCPVILGYFPPVTQRAVSGALPEAQRVLNRAP